jgi:hypothetical protein
MGPGVSCEAAVAKVDGEDVRGSWLLTGRGVPSAPERGGDADSASGTVLCRVGLADADAGVDPAEARLSLELLLETRAGAGLLTVEGISNFLCELY